MLRGILGTMKMLVKWLLLSAALMLVSQWDSGVVVNNYRAAMVAALVLGLLNAFVRPLLILLTLPVTVLSLGLFLFVINALTFQMASYLLDGFQVASFGAALLGSILYSLWGLVIDAALERMFVRPERSGPAQ
jgi:putative membrane protein